MEKQRIDWLQDFYSCYCGCAITQSTTRRDSVAEALWINRVLRFLDDHRECGFDL